VYLNGGKYNFFVKGRNFRGGQNPRTLLHAYVTDLCYYSFLVGSGWSLSAYPANRHVAVSTKEVGVNCVPMCRDVGVTTPSATSVNMSTMTERPPSVTATHTQTDVAAKPATTAAHTQTKNAVKPTTSVVHTQTVAITDVQPATVMPPTAVVAVTATTTANVGTQSSRPPAIRTVTIGVTARPRTYDASVAAKPTFKHVGCSADVTTDAKPAAAPMTRAAQTDARDDRSGHNRTTQTEAAALPEVTAVRANQTEAAATRANSTEVTATRANPTGSTVVRPNYATIGRRSNSFHHYTAAATADTSPTTVTSKIPRLKPVTPELNRKVLMRQDTYTKTAAEICTDDLQQQPSSSLSPPPRIADDVSR